MRLIHTDAPESAVVWVRRLLFGIWFLIALFDPIERLALLPPEVLRPQFPFWLLPKEWYHGFATSAGALLSLRLAMGGAALLAFFGVAFRWSGLATVLLAVCHESFGRSFEETNHAEIPLILVTALLVLFAVADRFSSRKSRPEETLVAITFVFLLTYTMVGIYRLAYGLPDVFLQPKMEAWAVERGTRIAYWDFGWGRFVADSPTLGMMLRGGFVIGTVMEVLALFALVSRRFRIAWAGLMLPMHALILLFMNIPFFENVVLYLFLIDMGIVRQKTPCVVLFDGVCNFCNGFVGFLAKRDPSRTLYFTASQSEAGQALMRRHGIAETSVEAGIHAIEGGRVTSRSTAVLRIARRLSLPWRLFSELAILPAAIWDPLYKRFAANRYRWFGKSAECRIPTDEERSRYLQDAGDLARIEGWQGGTTTGSAVGEIANENR